MSGVRLLIVGGVVVPVYASVEISQRYEPVRGVSRKRAADGTLYQRKLWPDVGAKLVTIVSGRGVIPAGLGEDGEVDYDSQILISCIAPRSVITTNVSVTLPAARRTDAGSLPFGRAKLGDAWVGTDVSMAGDVANITPVAGATQYQVVYFPEISVFADPPVEDKAERGPSYGWTLIGEEI